MRTSRPVPPSSDPAGAGRPPAHIPFPKGRNMLRIARACLVLTAALGMSAGCGGSSGAGGSYEPSPDAGERYILTAVGEMLRNRMLDTTKPPRGKADLARYE